MDLHSLASLREIFRPGDEAAVGSAKLEDAQALAEAVLDGNPYALRIARTRQLVTPSFPGSPSTRVTILEHGDEMRMRALMVQNFDPILHRSPDESKAGNEYGHIGPRALSAISMYKSSRAMIEISGYDDAQVKLYERHLDKLEKQYTSIQTAYWKEKDKAYESRDDDDYGDARDDGNTDHDEEGPQPEWFQKGELGIDLPSIHIEMCKRVSQTIYPCSD